MILTYQNQNKENELTPIENGMLNVGSYLSPPLPMYQYQQQYQQPQYNTSFIGNGMGSYYNNNYGSYYNPYYQRAQYEEAQKMYREQEINRRNADMAMLKIRMIAELGREVTEEEVQARYKQLTCSFDEAIDQEKVEELQLLESFQNTVNQQPQEIISYETARIINNYNYISEKYEDCEDMFDYFGRVEETLRDEAHRKQKEAQWNLSGSFNSNDFNSLLDIHNKSNMFSYTDHLGNPKEIDISDQIITLPNNITSEVASRRQRFIEEILKG